MAASTAPRSTRGAEQSRRYAEAAWGRYESAVRMGGTPEERAFAFDQALRAEERAASLELMAGVRTRGVGG